MTASFLGEDYLEIRNLTVDFDGFKAIDGVDLTLQQGRLHFLIGPNGAGKTTLVDALTGLVSGSGAALFRNHDILAMKSHKIVRLGIGRTFQMASVFEKLSVLQNLDIAAGQDVLIVSNVFLVIRTTSTHTGFSEKRASLKRCYPTSSFHS